MSPTQPARAGRPKYALLWSDEDRELARALSRLTGVRNTSDLIRNALRAQYRALTHRPFVAEAGDVPPKTDAATG